MQTHALRIHRATEADRPAVLKLLSEHMPATDVANRHAWLYEQNPHGRSITVIAYDVASGEPAGVTSVFPRRVLVRGRERLGSIGGDAFVPPAFRRRGIATELHKECMQLMHTEGVDFMFGPPEPLNLRALVKAGSRIITNVRRYARPRLIQRTFGRVARAFTSRRAELVPLIGNDRRINDIWARASDGMSVMPVRDGAHYAWRYASPTGAQRPFALVDGGVTLAICALEQREGHVAVIDLFAAKSEYSRAAFTIANLLPDASIHLQLNEAGPGAAALWQAGFLPREKKPFQVLAIGENLTEPGLFDAPSWYYTWGDGDIDRLF